MKTEANKFYGVGHIVITRQDKREAVLRRLGRMGIDAVVYHAVTPMGLWGRFGGVPWMRFGGAESQRAPWEHGCLLSHIGALGMARSNGWEMAGIWEDDVDGVADLGRHEIQLPSDCGVLYLGGILWGGTERYGQEFEPGLFRVDKEWPISCTHAYMVHSRAVDHILESMCLMDMTADDALGRACIEAMIAGTWRTYFVRPWLAWQQGRKETHP